MMVVMQALPHHHHGSSACLAHHMDVTHGNAGATTPHAHGNGAEGEVGGRQCHSCMGCMAVASARAKGTVARAMGRWLSAMLSSDNGIIRTDNDITNNYGARRACSLLVLALQSSGGLRAPPINS